MNSLKKEKLSKAVLNVTTYKEDPEDKFPPVEQYETIDITDLLEKRGITSVCSVHGLWSVGGPYLPGGDEKEFIVEYAVTDEELWAFFKDVTDILDIAIVNDKQNRTLKRILEDKFNDFIEEHWEPIQDCAETKACVDEALERSMGKK